MSVTLAQLLEETPKLELARPDEGVTEAMARMREHDYSQLPVVTGEPGAPRALGIISTTSIARASLYLNIPPAQLKVHHALDGHPIKRRLDDDLWRTLDEARDGEVLLVEDEGGVLRGVLTSHDFNAYLRQQSEDALTVRDIESTIKQLIQDHYRDREGELRQVVQTVLGHHQRSLEKSVRDVVSRCIVAVSGDPRELQAEVFAEIFTKKFPDKTPDDFDRLSFSQYQQILLGEPCWSAYADDFDLPVSHLRGLLDEARELRNRIAHHRGLPTPAERAKLDFCRELLGRVADRREDVAQGPSAPVSELPPAPEPRQAEARATEASSPEASEDDDDSPDTRSPLTTWLEGISGRDRVTLTFDALESQIAGGLPRAALEHRSWWTNDEEAAQSSHWLDANWRVISVNLTNKNVTFGRNTGYEQACIAAFGVIFRRLAESEQWHEPTRSPAGRSTQGLLNLAQDGGRAPLKLAFAKGDRFRISLYIDHRDKDANKATFDALAEQLAELEQRIGASLSWERLAHRRASRVALYYPRPISLRSAEDELDELAEWVARYVPPFCEAVRERYETRGQR